MAQGSRCALLLQDIPKKSPILELAGRSTAGKSLLLEELDAGILLPLPELTAGRRCRKNIRDPAPAWP